MALVLDIETVGQSIDAVPERALDYLFRGLERDSPEPEELEKRREDLVSRFGLDPTTGRVIVIGLVDTDKAKPSMFSGRGMSERSSRASGIGCRQTSRSAT